jgi:hypothetical protein
MSSEIELTSYKFVPIIIDILYKVNQYSHISDETKINIITQLLDLYEKVDKDTTDKDMNFKYMINDLNDIKKEIDNHTKNNTSISLTLNQIDAIWLYSSVVL